MRGTIETDANQQLRISVSIDGLGTTWSGDAEFPLTGALQQLLKQPAISYERSPGRHTRRAWHPSTGSGWSISARLRVLPQSGLHRSRTHREISWHGGTLADCYKRWRRQFRASSERGAFFADAKGNRRSSKVEVQACQVSWTVCRRPRSCRYRVSTLLVRPNLCLSIYSK